jgi:integrase/recombinase XerD
VARAYLDHLTVERGLAANTLAAYRRDLARYLETLAAVGVADLDAVTPGHVADHLAALREGDPGHPPLAAASAARAVSAVRGLHRFAHRERLTSTDAAREVPPPSPPRRLPRALEVDQVERLLAAAGPPGDGPDAGARRLRDRALLEFLYGTGARISEAVGACVDDLDLGDLDLGDLGGGAGSGGDGSTAGGMVRLRGKGGRDRLVPVGKYAVGAVRAWLGAGRPALARHGHGGPRLFLNARGGPLSRQGGWGILQEAARRAGLPVGGRSGVSPHTLRHSYATHLLDGGADVRVVQELLGHASVTTTQVYTLVTVERLREVYLTSHPRAR